MVNSNPSETEIFQFSNERRQNKNFFDLRVSQFYGLDLAEFREVLWVLFFIIGQITILYQTPFLQVDFIIGFYGMILIHFLQLLSLKWSESRVGVFSLYFDLMLFFITYALFPSFTSISFVFILIFLFMIGFFIEVSQVVRIAFFSSIMASLTNLFFVKWMGIQNLLSLVLFNSSILFISFIAIQYNIAITWLYVILTSFFIKR